MGTLKNEKALLRKVKEKIQSRVNRKGEAENRRSCGNTNNEKNGRKMTGTNRVGKKRWSEGNENEKSCKGDIIL